MACVLVGLSSTTKTWLNSQKDTKRSANKDKAAFQINMQQECCGQINSAEHKSQDNSEIMQMNGRMDGKTPAVRAEINKI